MMQKTWIFATLLLVITGCSGQTTYDDWRTLPYAEKQAVMAPYEDELDRLSQQFKERMPAKQYFLILDEIAKGPLGQTTFFSGSRMNTEEVLPQMFSSLVSMPPSFKTIDEDVGVIKPHFKTKQEYFDYWKLHYSLSFLPAEDIGMATDWICSQSSFFPPRKLDVFVAWELLGQSADKNWKGSNSPNNAIVGEWVKISRSKNPLYRLIGLRYANCFLNSMEAYHLSVRGLREKGSIFKAYALMNLGAIASPEAEQSIEDFLSIHANDGTWTKGMTVEEVGFNMLKLIHTSCKHNLKGNHEALNTDSQQIQEQGATSEPKE